MATPAIRALRQTFANERLVAVAKAYVAPVLDGNPWFDRTILTGGKGGLPMLTAAKELRGEQPRLAVLFPNSFRSALLAWLGGAKRIAGFNRYYRGWLLSDALAPHQDSRGKLMPFPALTAYNQIAMKVGCPDPGQRLELFTRAEDERAADQAWRQAGFQDHSEVICLNPGAAFGSAKLWPAEYFASLARELIRLRGAGVLILCGPKERELASRVAALAGHPLVRHLGEMGMPGLTLGLSRACVRRSHLLVTTDSGPRHFAHAFNRPVVTLFGPTHMEWTETWHPGAMHLQKKLPCGPCQKRVCPLQHQCMKELSVAEVLNASLKLLDAQLERAQPARFAS